jgi:lysyl endopeptidase
MRKLIKAIPFVVLSLPLAIQSAIAAPGPLVDAVESEFLVETPNAKATIVQRFVGFTPEHMVPRVKLIGPSADDLKAVRMENAVFEKQPNPLLQEDRNANDDLSNPERRRAHQVGLPALLSEEGVQQLSKRAMRWTPDGEGGVVARFDVTSDDAKAIRLGFTVDNVPSDAVLRFVGSGENDRVYAVTGADIAANGGEYWSPIVLGDTISVEVQLRSSRDRANYDLKVFGASHLFGDPTSTNNDLFKATKAGSQSCEVNIVCSSDTAARNVAAAVARMVYTSGGSSFLCTGTLLNDTDTSTQRPFFYSANHCISTQTVANTLQTFWNYQSTTCGGTSPGAFTTRAGGAFLRVTDFNSDISLLELKESPPSGALYAGWNAGQAANGSSIVGIHHPAGDIKKISLGSITNNNAPAFGGKTGRYYEVVWTSGVTEGGSSGSGIFTRSSSGSYQLRGGLLGGSSFCTAQSSPDVYSRMDLKFSILRPFLAP